MHNSFTDSKGNKGTHGSTVLFEGKASKVTVIRRIGRHGILLELEGDIDTQDHYLGTTIGPNVFAKKCVLIR